MAIVAFFSSRATTVTTLFSLYVGYIENVRASLFHSSAHTEEMKEKWKSIPTSILAFMPNILKANKSFIEGRSFTKELMVE